MKMRYAFIVGLAVTAIGAFLVISKDDVAGAGSSQVSPPTPAPTKTPGPAATNIPLVIPALPGGPLIRTDQVLLYALSIDRQDSVWDQPWTLDTPKTDPARITIELFPTQSAADGANQSEFAPGHDEAIGPVWRVTILGRVHVEMLGMNINLGTNVYGGVTYTIAQRSGALVGVAAGPLIPGAVFTRPPRPTDSPPVATSYP